MKVDYGYINLEPPIVKIGDVKYTAHIAMAQNPRILLDRDVFLCTWVDLHYNGTGSVQGFGGHVLETLDNFKNDELTALTTVSIMNLLDVFGVTDFQSIAGKWVYGLKEYNGKSHYGQYLDGLMSVDCTRYFIPKIHYAAYIEPAESTV